jgi:26S proteasome regulatory subunit T5
LPADKEELEEEGAAMDAESAGQEGKCAVIKTSSRQVCEFFLPLSYSSLFLIVCLFVCFLLNQTVFLPVVGLVDPKTLRPGDLVGVHKDSYLILESLPAEYDPRVKAMEVDERPTEEYNDVGGLDTQIQELQEAIVLPIKHKDRFDSVGIKPPKGVLMYGPPGTGKTLLARACAAQTNACFLKLAGPQLVQVGNCETDHKKRVKIHCVYHQHQHQHPLISLHCSIDVYW